MAKYKKELVNRYWEYQERFFPEVEDYFDQPNAHLGRPPVFITQQAWRNVIFNPYADPGEFDHLLSMLPATARHKWFGSMNSSQALAQSVLGNLAIYDHLSCLADIMDDDGEPLLGKARALSANFSMEHKVSYLAEPMPTSLDGLISDPYQLYQVAIECKFTEAEVGPCSRPLLKRLASNYATDACAGSYTHQRGRRERCTLTEIGVLYWKYLPALFKWQSDRDIDLCPLNKTYQLVRNILAVCVRPNGTVSAQNGHVVLIYDERNPAFQADGNGLRAFDETRKALLDANVLRKCSWQTIIGHLKKERLLPWLTEQLDLKYGLRKTALRELRVCNLQ